MTDMICEADDKRAHQGNPVPAIALFGYDDDGAFDAQPIEERVPMCLKCALDAGCLELPEGVTVYTVETRAHSVTTQ